MSWRKCARESLKAKKRNLNAGSGGRNQEHAPWLNATLESTADGILVVDTGGKIVSFNRKFAQTLAHPESIVASG